MLTECDAELEMACHSNGTECVSLTHKCDGVVDCSNGRDESDDLCSLGSQGL